VKTAAMNLVVEAQMAIGGQHSWGDPFHSPALFVSRRRQLEVENRNGPKGLISQLVAGSLCMLD